MVAVSAIATVVRVCESAFAFARELRVGDDAEGQYLYMGSAGAACLLHGHGCWAVPLWFFYLTGMFRSSHEYM